MKKLIGKKLVLAALLMVTVGCVELLADTYQLYSGAITEGDYLIVYNGGAMRASVNSSDRFRYTTIDIVDDRIKNPNSDLVWTITADNYVSGTYRLYNSKVSQYAASTGKENKGALTTTISDKIRWTITGSSTYEFVNKENSKNKVNANLRRNGEYGFACYSTSTGGALTLYKKILSTPTIAVSDQTIAYGETYTLDTSGFASGDVTLTSSNTAVATVDGLTLTSVAAGSTTITVSTAETEDYEAGEETFTLTVTGPEGNTTNIGALNATTTVTTAGGFATYCYLYPLNLDGLVGAKAYKVSNVDLVNERVNLTQLTGTIQGGVPFILKADGEDATFDIPLAESSTNIPDDNALLGTLVPTFVPQTSGDITYFAYSKTKECFVKIGSAGNTVPANRAYLPVNLSSEVKAFTLFFADTDGINTLQVKKEGVNSETSIFNLAGQRLDRFQKGINIVNGTKMIVK